MKSALTLTALFVSTAFLPQAFAEEPQLGTKDLSVTTVGVGAEHRTSRTSMTPTSGGDPLTTKTESDAVVSSASYDRISLDGRTFRVVSLGGQYTGGSAETEFSQNQGFVFQPVGAAFQSLEADASWMEAYRLLPGRLGCNSAFGIEGSGEMRSTKNAAGVGMMTPSVPWATNFSGALSGQGGFVCDTDAATGYFMAGTGARVGQQNGLDREGGIQPELQFRGGLMIPGRALAEVRSELNSDGARVSSDLKLRPSDYPFYVGAVADYSSIATKPDDTTPYMSGLEGNEGRLQVTAGWAAF